MKALLNYTDYTKLNEALSKLEGYPKRKTLRIWPMYPAFAKVNQTFDTEGNEVSFDLACVADIPSRFLEDYPEHFEGLNLVNDWEVEPYEGEIDLLELEDLTTEQIDWWLNNFDEQGYYKEDLTVLIGNEQPTTLDTVEKLVNKGLNIGIYEKD